MKANLRLISLIVFSFLLTSIYAQDNSVVLRTKANLNDHWAYSENVTSEIGEIQAELNWSTVDLPHSWNAKDATDLNPGYRRNSSWYKKTIDFEVIAADKSYLLYFEGANISTHVYVNGQKVGTHIGGYLGFEVDITPYIKQGPNELLIRVDNSYNRDIIPSQKSDFVIYGGITRDLWLLTRPKTNIKKLLIQTPQVSKQKASLQVTTQLNDMPVKGMELEISLVDPNNRLVSEKTVPMDSKRVNTPIKTVQHPMLWSPDTPRLYTIKTRLLQDSKVIDSTSDTFGFRWFEFKDYGAFYLNGERLKIRGTHRHEEHAGVGAAMSNAQHIKDIEMIKEMGANFIRLAHYPQDPEIYKACDRLGLLVWDELPWCRGGIGEEDWKANTKRMFSELIIQNYNHPSIILWSLGNEISWLPDFEGGGDVKKINPFLETLNQMAHDLDPQRKTAMRKYYEGAEIVDVFSPSIWAGWYSGNYKNYQKAVDTYKEKYKHFIHAEYGASGHLGRHSENPIDGDGIVTSEGWEEVPVQNSVRNIAQFGDWSENYMVDLMDWYLRVSELDTNFVGNLQWAFKDFATPLRPENAIPYMNQKGIMDRAGNPKDAYYVFKSYWAETPFVYIESHSWTQRQGPEGKPRKLSVYSNCEEVTLYHNGKSLGRKKKNILSFPASGLEWELQFDRGENTLVAIGESDTGTVVRDTLAITYRYKENKSARALTLKHRLLDNGNYLVTAAAVDKDGLRCFDYEKRIYFQCLSGGKTKNSMGTPTGSEVIEMANGKASIEVVPDLNSDTTVISVLNQEFKGTYYEIINP